LCSPICAYGSAPRMLAPEDHEHEADERSRSFALAMALERARVPAEPVELFGWL
jgi:hypothetical protein